jgi:hypothetical protein
MRHIFELHCQRDGNCPQTEGSNAAWVPGNSGFKTAAYRNLAAHPVPPRSLHRIGVDPVSRVGSYWSEMIIRLGLIEIARIKAKAVGRPQFPMVDVTYV